MSLKSGDLTSKQKLVWRLKSKEYNKSSIARKLKIIHQTIRKGFNKIKQEFFTHASPVIIGIFVVTGAIFKKGSRGGENSK